MSATSVTVVGSANLDIALRVARIPAPGETVLSTATTRSPGGKGANQAVGAARSGGAAVTVVAAVGDDAAAQPILASLTAAGVGTATIRRLATAPTGAAYISVADDGENAIVVAPGANAELTDLTAAELDGIARAEVTLASLEIPMATVLEAARASRRFVLNAAPAAPLPAELWPHLDVLVVNEHEARDLAGSPSLEAALSVLGDRGPALVVTLGADGAIVAGHGTSEHVPGFPAQPVDTTGAGDCFCGVLAARLALGDDLVTATRWGCAAGALAVQDHGAADAMPTVEAVAGLIEQAER